MITLHDVLERIHTGPVCKVQDWDMMVSVKAKEIAKKHGLVGIYDPDNPVSTDDSLADACFAASLDYLEEMGCLCVATERVIKLSRREIAEGLGYLPATSCAGSGADSVTYHHRAFEDETPCVTVLGAFGHPMTEDLFSLHSQAVMQHPLVDCHIAGTLVTAHGLTVRSGTPLETLAGYHEARLVKEAAHRAHRPGMPIYGVELSSTGYGTLGGFTYGGYTVQDPFIWVQLAELKTDYSLLHKLVHRSNIGGARSPLMSHSATAIGGYAGGPDTSVLVCLASCLGGAIISSATLVSHKSFDAWTSADTARHCIWCDSVIDNALARNTHLIVGGGVGPVAGPYTEMHLLETAARALSDVVCGCGQVMGVKATHGRYANHTSPIEAWLAAEVAKAAAGLKREHANAIVKELLPRYEANLKDPPRGRSFAEGFDLKRLKPKEDVQQLLDSVRRELRALGVPLGGPL